MREERNKKPGFFWVSQWTSIFSSHDCATVICTRSHNRCLADITWPVRCGFPVSFIRNACALPHFITDTSHYTEDICRNVVVWLLSTETWRKTASDIVGRRNTGPLLVPIVCSLSVKKQDQLVLPHWVCTKIHVLSNKIWCNKSTTNKHSWYSRVFLHKSLSQGSTAETHKRWRSYGDRDMPVSHLNQSVCCAVWHNQIYLLGLHGLCPRGMNSLTALLLPPDHTFNVFKPKYDGNRNYFNNKTT